MTLRVANAMLMNFESVHVVEELGEWLKNWPGVRFGYNVLPQNMERFAFILERKNERSMPTMGGVVIPFEAISACKSMYAAIHTMMELKNKRRDGSEKMRFGSLPETLSIRIERHQLDGDGEVALDVTPLNCAWVMDFGEIGFNDLVSDGVKPRRYEMIGAIIGMRVQAAPGDTAAMGNPANTIQTMAVMRSPEGVWYKVDHASKMDDYMCRGKPIEAEELYAMVGCEQGKLAPASRRDTPYFVMHLYYRDHKMLMPIPKSDEHPSRFLPCAFHDLFDSSHSERVEGTAQIAQFIRTLVQADGGDRDKVSLRDVIKYAPSLTHLSDIDYGTRNPMPKNMFALMDKDGTLIGRTAYQLFRARMLTQLCSVFGIVAEESGTDARQEQVEAILQAAQDEWNEPLNPLDKLSWIAVADYFNRSHYSMATPSATSPKTPPMLLKRHTDNYNTAPGTRMTARSLFAEQWPVLVDKKIEFNSLSAEEQKDPGKRMRFMNETPLKPHAVADEGVRECKRAIKLVKEDTLLMDMIWEEMEPKSREVFSGLAKARNEMKLLTRQGMCETWETMPFTMNDDGEGFDPSVFRLEVVCGAMPSFDPRAVKLRELEAKTDAGTPYFVNGHVMLAMREEIANPSVNYAAPNFGLVYDDKIWFSEACSEKVRNVLGAKESVPTTCISVDPISGMSISDTLTIARAHAMYSKDNVFLTKQRAQVLKPPDTLAVKISPHPVEVRDPEAIPEEGMDVSIGKMQCLNMLHRRDVGPVMVGIDLTMTGECFTSATDFKGRNYELVGLLYQKHTARKHELGMTTDILHAGTHRGAMGPGKVPPQVWSKVRTVMSGVVQEPAWTTFWVRHNHPEHGWKWDRQGYDCKIIRRCDDEESHDPPEQLLLGSDEDGNEYSVVAYYRYSDHVINEVNCQCRLWDMMQNPCSVEEKEVSLSLMASSSFLREMIYHVSSSSMRATTADKILKVFMITLCDPSHSRKSFEAAIRLTGDTSLQHDEFVSFMASRTFAKKKLSGYYQQEEKARKRRPVAGCDGTHAPVIELTEEEREQLAIEHAKELKRKWVAEAEARARSAAIQAERVERERLAAEEAAAAAEALREQQKVAEAERAARAAEEARVLREAREEKAVREKAVAEARAAVENQKAKDEAAAKAAKVAMAKEARKAKREANKERKHAPLDVKTQVTRDAAQRKQKQTSEQKAAELAAKMAAEKEAKEAAEKERARIEAARADAAAAAKAAAVKQHKAHKKAERVSALEAEGIADEAELAEAWLSSHSSQPSRSSDPVPPLSPVSTSTATSSRVLCEYENECIVCFSAPQTHLCTHCFNLALCGACADTMTTCPVCREETEFRMVHRP